MPYKYAWASKEYQKQYYLDKKRKSCSKCSKLIRITSSLCCGCYQRNNKIFGRKPSLETRLKMSESRRGSKNWHWRGGISSLSLYIRSCFKMREWKRLCMKRDYYRCQMCGDDKGHNLQVDHIKPFALILFENCIKLFSESQYCEELWDINNGRTLCINCHKRTKTYGVNKISILNKLYYEVC